MAISMRSNGPAFYKVRKWPNPPIHNQLLEYDKALTLYGELIALILNEFARHSKPADYDGPIPGLATVKDGTAIIEGWLIDALKEK